MAMISSLWDTLIGKKQSSSNKASKADSAAKRDSAARIDKSTHNHNHIHLEKRKLVATRAKLEAQAANKLDLDHLRARIDSDSRDYAVMRERQQTSISRWFGERASGIDEAALTKRLAAPTPQLSQEEFELSLNYSDIHLPDYYVSQVVYLGEAAETPLPSGFALDCPEDVETTLADIIDSADFSDLAADFADITLMPPLVALSDNIPELDDLLARLQIVEQLEKQNLEGEPVLAHQPDLHIVTPFEVCAPSQANAPVPMIKRHGKGKKARRARSKEAAKIKNGTRN